MAAQTLDQIISSLQSVYQPQLDSVATQQAALPAQYDAQAQGLNAQKNDAFNQILSGAQQRGTGVAFGGIPLGEQAQYTASTYAPALANLATAQTQQQQSLADQINSINEDKFNSANNLYQFGVQQDATAAALAEQAREADQTNATARASAAASNSAIPTQTGSTGNAPSANNTSKQDVNSKNLTGGKSIQDAYNAVQALLNTKNPNVITQTFKAIQQSANYGNTYDQQKILAINSLPAFKSYLQNSNNATF